MTRTLAYTAIVLAALTPVALADKKEPKLEEHTSDAGKFRVKFPGKPKVDSKELGSGPGGVQAIPVTTERVEGSNGVVYAVTFADYPDTFLGVKAATVLDGVRDGMRGKDGTVKEYKEVTLNGTIPGREIRIEAGKRVVRARVFLTGTRLYQVMVTGDKQPADGKSADEFLKSFEIVK
jgi:hypothetical protein